MLILKTNLPKRRRILVNGVVAAAMEAGQTQSSATKIANPKNNMKKHLIIWIIFKMNDKQVVS